VSDTARQHGAHGQLAGAKQASLPILRAEIDRLSGPSRGRAMATGIAALDETLGGAGLRRHCLHEISGYSAPGLLVALLARAKGPVLWCTPQTQATPLYPPGLMQAGLDPARLTRVACPGTVDGLWAGEEALKSGAFAHVVIELHGPVALTAGRRLALAAEAGGATGFITPAYAGPARLDAGACWTRWHVSPLPARRQAPCWRIALTRNRGGNTGQWDVEWDAQAVRLSLVSSPSGRQAEACAPARLA